MRKTIMFSSLFTVFLMFGGQSVSANEIATPSSSPDANAVNQKAPIPLSLSDAYKVTIEKSDVKVEDSAQVVSSQKDVIPLSLSDAYEVRVESSVPTLVNGVTVNKPVFNFYFKNIVVNQSYTISQDKSFVVKGHSSGVKITKNQVVGNTREIAFYVTSKGQHTITLENDHEIRNLIYQTQ
ncbi:hypothetical protein P4S93_15060 [Aneurinibacillus thermoaerophilus]|uniref:Uncharacterized protein n=1 Tax=Aneurinibacillus thermoaerophilus TaxID=143495 RepID=A0A1G7ZMJ4_ANETH|nr:MULTISPECIES: hypothetical protein [Aneurinibacillus]AMA72459.1 hypothetical protein ACH33_06065 [Aneurinibacillus sp. XH2]MED0675661.1 hypothetical protein [Aneurinibacillus thermoaerophilus]MED0679935.1 hypothetical protein [Aneurinibacillus thermoaerophilus]MED0757257.1 hypothetical protein [Aneurinibacillus thermoaerophilus]MED0762079.1 hypothetical protein [Aneurinibacillus thermoaerophilus]